VRASLQQFAVVALKELSEMIDVPGGNRSGLFDQRDGGGRCCDHQPAHVPGADVAKAMRHARGDEDRAPWAGVRFLWAQLELDLALQHIEALLVAAVQVQERHPCPRRERRLEQAKAQARLVSRLDFQLAGEHPKASSFASCNMYSTVARHHRSPLSAIINIGDSNGMNKHVKPSRAYRSQLRAEQAQHTRARITEAAQALFLERGFAATTIAAVAEQAGVAPETVYANYRNKPGLLEGVVRSAVFRDGEPTEVLQAGWVKALLGLPDLPAQIAALARHTAQTVALTSPIYAAMTGAGTGSGDIDELRRKFREIRFSGQAAVIAAIATEQTVRPGLTVQDAADTFSALASPELHHILTTDRGWSQERYARWLEQTTKVALLPD
jgi:AcrR family transcriptional regulator